MKRRTTRGISFLLALTMLFSLNVTAAFTQAAERTVTIYVDVNGNDISGDGSQSAPFASVNQARLKARELKGPGKTVSVQVNPGKYFVSEPIRFSPEDSGVNYQGTGAVLTGARNLSPTNWTVHSGAVMVADVPRNLGIDQLFVNGQQKILARYPNYNPAQVLQGSTSQGNIRQRTSRWANPAGGFMRALHNHKWGGNSYKITGKNSSALGLSYTWIGDNNRGSGYHSEYLMVENIFEELDDPKEWYYDSNNGKLYYYPEDGLNVNSAQFEGAVTEEIIHIEGVKDGAQVTDITFSGFTLQDTKRTMFTSTYIPLLRSDWCVVRKGALFMQDAENITFENGKIQRIGGNAVFLSGHCKGINVTNNEIVDIGSSGVLVAGLPDSVREPSFWADTPSPEIRPYFVHKTSINDRTPGPIREHYPRESSISNNHIKNVGIWEKQSSQINISIAYKISMMRNTLNLGPRAGINIGDGAFGGHTIAYNDIFDVQRETDDHGMFNSWGRDRFWSLNGFDTGGNRGTQKEPFSKLDVIDPIIIRDNRMHFAGRLDGGGTFGIDLDDGSSNYKIYNNLCLNLGIKLREGFHREVYNNILVNGVINLHCTYEHSYDKIERNIIIKGSPYSLAATDKGRFANSQNVIDNNWTFDFGMKTVYPSYWPELGYDANTIYGNPNFKNPAANDYTVENTALAEKIGFENFPMDQYGKPGCKEQSPFYVKDTADGNEDIYEEEVWNGATISALDDAIMSSTGAGGLDGVYVKEAPQESLAVRNGLKPIDVIKTVNGRTIGKKSNFTKIYDAIEDNTIVSFGIIRNQLKMTVNYVKADPIVSETLVDDHDAAISYSGFPWTRKNTEAGAINRTITAKMIREAEEQGETRVYCEMDFTGRQVALFGRTQSNMGNYDVTITDRNTQQVVQNKVASAFGGPIKDGVELFRSDLLPQGEYKIKVERLTGEYEVIDAFKVWNHTSSTAYPVVIEPAVVTSGGTRVTELTSDKDLDISIPVKNNGSEPVDLTIVVALKGGDGTLKMEHYQEFTKVIPANTSETIELDYDTPAESEKKKLEILVFDTKTLKPYAFPHEISGTEVNPKHVQINQAKDDNILYTYNLDNGIVTVSANGFAARSQVLITVKGAEDSRVSLLLSKVDDAGNAKGAFMLGSGYKGVLSVEMKGENGKSKTTEIDIQDKEIKDYTLLNEKITAAAPLIAGNNEAYTKDSWIAFYNAYFKALAIRDADTESQEQVDEAARILSEAQSGLTDRNVQGQMIPSQATRGQYEVFRRDGSVDGGDRDAGGGDEWQVRHDHIDGTVFDCYAEFKGNYTHIEFWGANKHDTAKFKVVITDDETNAQLFSEVITPTKTDGNNVVRIYMKSGLSGKPQTIRVYHQDESTVRRYIEIWKVVYAERLGESVGKVSKIDITKLPERTSYERGYPGSISLAGGEITETYENGSTNVIPMNAGMYKEGFSTETGGEKQIKLTHAGLDATFPVMVAAPEKYTATVVNGSGGGQYEEGMIVKITADPAPEGKQFNGWTSEDGVTFADAGAMETTFEMPAKAVTVTAVFTDIPVVKLKVTSAGISNSAPIVGDVLTVIVNPAGATVLYSWKVGGQEKSTAPAYEVKKEDVGQTITVTVTGIENYTGTVTSPATEAVRALADRKTSIQSVLITNLNPRVGDVLAAIVKPDSATVKYSWTVDGTEISTEASYKVRAQDLGKKIAVKVTGVDDFEGEITGTATNSVREQEKDKPVKPGSKQKPNKPVVTPPVPPATVASGQPAAETKPKQTDGKKKAARSSTGNETTVQTSTVEDKTDADSKTEKSDLSELPEVSTEKSEANIGGGKSEVRGAEDNMEKQMSKNMMTPWKFVIPIILLIILLICTLMVVRRKAGRDIDEKN